MLTFIPAQKPTTSPFLSSTELYLSCRARTWVRIFGKGQNSDLEAKLGQNKVRIWFKSQNNVFFVKYNERICLFIIRIG